MAFQLNGVVPWGRTFDEYRAMFLLSDGDLSKRIAGFGDGPASFNYQARQQGCSVTSFDPIYQFTRGQMERRIEEVRPIVMRQMAENAENYVWTDIRDLADLEQRRMSAMKLFLSDFERGRAEGRYIAHELPNRVDFSDNTFDIGLSSHFLLMYTALGYDFHIAAISEMLRVCREVRIFPILDLDGQEVDMIHAVIGHFREKYSVEIRRTDYEFQKGGDQLLIIQK